MNELRFLTLVGCLLFFFAGCGPKEQWKEVNESETQPDVTAAPEDNSSTAISKTVQPAEPDTVKPKADENPPTKTERIPTLAENPEQPPAEQIPVEQTQPEPEKVEQVDREPVKAPKPEVTLPPRKIELLIPEKSFKKAAKEEALLVSYDDIDLLKVLNMEPVPLDAVDHFPSWLKELDGQRIRIRGFMYPNLNEAGIEKFLLARDNEICCFGRDPKIYDIIRVKMKEGTTTSYILSRPFDVIGTFHIQPVPWDETKLYSLYKIDDAVIIKK